jgi:hypothetical protein
LHSCFGEPKERLDNINRNRYQSNLCDRLKHVKLIVVDEFSMVEAAWLPMLETSLRRARDNNTFAWGGYIILFCGDPLQLRSVVGASLIQSLPSQQAEVQLSYMTQAGLTKWHSITNVIELIENVRHRTDPAFADAVLACRLGKPSSQHLDLLNTRVQQDSYYIKDCICAMPKNKQVKVINQHRMSELSNPTVISWATHTVSHKYPDLKNDSSFALACLKHGGVRAKKDVDDMLTADSRLYISVGCIVRLTKNLNVTAGLVNGAVGTVVKIVLTPPSNAALDAEVSANQVVERYYANVTDAANSFLQPPIVFVQFDAQYFSDSAPSWSSTLRRVVPIIYKQARYSIKVSYNNRLIPVTRWQLPLTVAYATTIHKVQGLTISKLSTELTDPFVKASPCLAYVAISRVRKLADLYLQKPLTKHIFRVSNTMPTEWYRLQHLSNLTTTGTCEKCNEEESPSTSAQNTLKCYQRHMQAEVLNHIPIGTTTVSCFGLINSPLLQVCWFNASFQCLLSSRYFVEQLKPTNPLHTLMQTVTSATVGNPVKDVEGICRLSSNVLQLGLQQDASEGLQYILQYSELDPSLYTIQHLATKQCTACGHMDPSSLTEDTVSCIRVPMTDESSESMNLDTEMQKYGTTQINELCCVSIVRLIPSIYISLTL